MRKSIKIWIVIIIVLIIIVTGSIVLNKYNDIFNKNVRIENSDYKYIYVPTGADFNTLFSILSNDSLLIDTISFKWLAKKKNLTNHIYAGRYKVHKSMCNNDLINMFRSGNQSPVKVSFIKLRTKNQLAGVISTQIEADSISILNLLNSDSLIKSLGMTKATIMSIFIPNTYEFYWNTSAKGFINRIVKEHKSFWSDERINKAKKIGLSKEEVSTLASIVEEETIMNDEKPRLAGVYINRIKKGIPLQADPTLKFALQNFAKRRITNRDKEVDSPYNTYANRSLPPGPICLPTISSIDAVLNYSKHGYYYFCAKDDFSGYHNFSKSLREHNLYAKKYHRALNKRRIYN